MENENLEVLNQLEYLIVLKALKEIGFGVGKKMLTDFLKGKETSPITRNRLYTLKNFGTYDLDEDKINSIIDNLILNGLIQIKSLESNRFMKLLSLTNNGELEINEPSLYKRKISFNLKEKETKISLQDLELFKKHENFLYSYNPEQKKSIISNAKEILCVAGAGSGKTSVLTKRIEFLVKHKQVEANKILAITFTRKAKEEMQNRLYKISELNNVRVETFNSFCEKILRTYNNKIYNKPVRVINYGDKITIIKLALKKMNLSFSDAIKIYFEGFRKNDKDEEHLTNIFMNDCFFIRDYFKFKNKIIEESDFDISDEKNRKNVRIVVEVCGFIEGYMKRHGLRDFADQLIDTINFFENNNQVIPKFKHILIDEYQDVNSTQIKLLDLLEPNNIFCVGDPRQSIYGWRGSDIRYILNFDKKYNNCEVITLTKNYRSNKKILDLINDSVNGMGFSDLETGIFETYDDNNNLELLNFDSEQEEYEFISSKILDLNLRFNNIFVLARTNNQLNDITKKFNELGIEYILKTEYSNNSKENNSNPNPRKIVLATIHAIKGLEADIVFVIGCTANNFPCKGSEHPIVEMVKVEEYDKEEEERRLFYVAMSRAKKNLYLTYNGNKHTYFIKDSMKQLINPIHKSTEYEITKLSDNNISNNNNSININNSEEILDAEDSLIMDKLKSWRKEISKEQELPAYCIVNNKSLLEIVRKKPTSFEDLIKIHGVGDAKIEKYGSQILRIIEENE